MIQDFDEEDVFFDDLEFEEKACPTNGFWRQTFFDLKMSRTGFLSDSLDELVFVQERYSLLSEKTTTHYNSHITLVSQVDRPIGEQFVNKIYRVVLKRTSISPDGKYGIIFYNVLKPGTENSDIPKYDMYFEILHLSEPIYPSFFEQM
ncbi:MAG: hypothetical protein CMK92_06650 [Pseudomonas sp.]|nr:hypothetical protein [Pseudomonas sp.]